MKDLEHLNIKCFLHHAVADVQGLGNEESHRVLEFLLEQGLSISQLDSSHSQPLHLAAFGQNLPAVKLLIERGADKGAKNKNGETPLMVFAARRCAMVSVPNLVTHTHLYM